MPKMNEAYYVERKQSRLSVLKRWVCLFIFTGLATWGSCYVLTSLSPTENLARVIQLIFLVFCVCALGFTWAFVIQSSRNLQDSSWDLKWFRSREEGVGSGDTKSSRENTNG